MKETSLTAKARGEGRRTTNGVADSRFDLVLNRSRQGAQVGTESLPLRQRHAKEACTLAIRDMRRTVRGATRVLFEHAAFKPFRLLIRARVASSGLDRGGVVAVELHAQLNAFPAACQAMPIGVP